VCLFMFTSVVAAHLNTMVPRVVESVCFQFSPRAFISNSLVRAVNQIQLMLIEQREDVCTNVCACMVICNDDSFPCVIASLILSQRTH
jgi:hypothetical protein